MVVDTDTWLPEIPEDHQAPHGHESLNILAQQILVQQEDDRHTFVIVGTIVPSTYKFGAGFNLHFSRTQILAS